MQKTKLKIIYQDKYLIVIDKPSNLLTISTSKEKEKTLYHQVYIYEKQKHKNNKIFIVHRLDKDTSGVIVFAKDIKVKKILQDSWQEHALNREYIAIVEGNVSKNQDTIRSYLKETSTFHTYSSTDSHGKLAITTYKKLLSNKNYSMLKINIQTGRKNQIRVHLSDIKHPIIGDKKYYAKSNPLNRLGLHASRLELLHPINKTTLILTSPIPKEFNSLFN